MLIFTEESIEDKKARAEEKFFAELDKKIGGSKWFSCEVRANCEIYHLDKIDISFDIRKIYLVVTNKIGIETKMMDCKFDANSDLQQKRFSSFCSSLAHARTRNYAENERRKQKQQHDKKSCEVESIKKELAAHATHRRIKRQKLGIRALMRQSVMRAFRGRGL